MFITLETSDVMKYKSMITSKNSSKFWKEVGNENNRITGYLLSDKMRDDLTTRRTYMIEIRRQRVKMIVNCTGKLAH